MIITKDVNNKKDDIASASVQGAEAEERNDDETDLHQEVLCQVSIWAIQADTLLWIFNNVHIPLRMLILDQSDNKGQATFNHGQKRMCGHFSK